MKRGFFKSARIAIIFSEITYFWWYKIRNSKLISFQEQSYIKFLVKFNAQGNNEFILEQTKMEDCTDAFRVGDGRCIFICIE